MGPVRAQRCPARLHVLHSHTGAWFRSEAGSTRRQTYTAASLRVSRPIWSRVCKASHRRFRGGPRSGLPCVRAPKPRQRPPRARHRAVNSTPTRRPCSATDGAAANSPPVSLPFTVTGDRFSAPNNNWSKSRPICGPNFGRADPQFNPFEASPAMFAAMRLASSHLAQRAPNVPSVAATCS